MEQAERGAAARSQNVVHFLPRTTDALTRVVTPALERVDVTEPTLQVLVVTPDAETAIVAGEVVLAMTGAQGIEVVPVTSANRAARLLADRPAHAIAGPAIEIQALVQRSAIKLDGIKTVILAWMDDEASVSAAAMAALEALMTELPKEADRVLIARHATPEVEQIIDRYLRTARRVSAHEPESGEQEGGGIAGPAVPVHYVMVSASSRPAALRRLLDDLDPPSTAILVREPATEADVTHTIRSLGYRRASDPVRVARYDAIPQSHTVILYDAPVLPSELTSLASAGSVQIVALVTPRDAVPLHELVGNLVPLTLDGPGAAARSRDAMLREELAVVLAQGVVSREVLALEPLLERYDGVEIAAAAVRLLELQRADRAAHTGQTGLRLVGAQPRSDKGSREGSSDRGSSSSRGSSARGGDRSDRSSREPRNRDTRDRDFRGPPRGNPRGGPRDQAEASAPRPQRGEWTPKRPPRDGAPPERRERDLGRGPRSGGAGAAGSRSGGTRDDRPRPPRGSAPRPSRPFER